jgi:hypothetical protein
MTTPDEAARLYPATSATLELECEPAPASLSAQPINSSLNLPEAMTGNRGHVRQSGTTNLLFDIAALIALPILLLILNNSWSFGWVDTPPGSVWIDAGNRKEAPPPGWLVNYTADSLDTPIGWVDPYIYQSFFLDLRSNLLLHKESWADSYYPSRLPWLLLGNAVYSIASPETANLLLRLLLFYVAIFSLYSIVRLVTSNDLAALVAALLLGVNTYFLWAIGWNYVDGFGVTIILLMLALLTKAAISETWRMALALGGIAAATAVSVNIFLVVVMPGALLWYLSINAKRRCHGRVASVALMIAGGVTAFTVFGLINQYLTGNPLYLLPQISWVVSGPTASTRHLYPEAGWLVIPGAAAAISLVFVLLGVYRRVCRRSFSEAESLGITSAAVFLQLLGIFAFLEFFSRSNVLEHAFYASYLLPFAYLVIGTAAHLISSRCAVPARLRPLFVAGLILCLLAPFALAQLRFMPGCPEGCLSSGRLQLLLVAAFGLITIALFTRNVRVGLALLMVFSLVNVGVADRRVLTFSSSEREAMHHRSSMVFDADAVVQRHNAHNDMRYWIDLADQFGWVYSAVAGQNLWNQRLVSLEFPKLRPNVELIPGDRIVLASASGDDIVLRANETLIPYAIHLEVFEQSRIQRGKDGFDLFLTTVMPGALLQQRLGQSNTLDRLPTTDGALG